MTSNLKLLLVPEATAPQHQVITPGKEAIIRFNGQDYRFTVSLNSKASGWRDITHSSQKDWTQIATDVTALLVENAGKGSIDDGQLILAGSFSDIEKPAPILNPKRITLVSAAVDGTDLGLNNLSGFPLPQKQKIEQRFNCIRNDFVSIKSISSSSVQSNLPLTSSFIANHTREIDASGRCADASLAYQILKRAGYANLLNDPNKKKEDKDLIFTIASYLRISVAAKITEDAGLDQDFDFIDKHLIKSIKDIPTQKPNNIALILQKQPRSREDIETLRKYYASYILSANMLNYLDSAFLYILPKIEVHQNLKPYFPYGFRCVVIQENGITALYPENAELELDDWLYIYYNGINHYLAVKTDEAATRTHLEQMLQARKQRIQDDLVALISSDGDNNAEQIKLKLIEEIPSQHPALYDAIVGAIAQTGHSIDALQPTQLKSLLKAQLNSIL